jgi:hypothetical protein
LLVLLVLQARASRGLPLFHPDDATEADDAPIELTLFGSVRAPVLPAGVARCGGLPLGFAIIGPVL